jgi:M6 family metalloprotease-like protein
MTKLRFFLLALCIAFVSNTIYASYLSNYPVEVKQPDGTVVQLFATGDEFHHRVHDANGYTIIQDVKTGNLFYAVLKNDELVSSGYLYGKVDPKTVKLSPNIDISAQKYTQIRQVALDKIPKKQLPKNYRAGEGKRTGTLNNIVVYIVFQGESGFSKPTTYYEDIYNSNDAGASLYSYYRDISGGQFFIQSSFFPAVTSGTTVLYYTDSQPRNYYQPYNATTNTNGYHNDTEEGAREQTLLTSAINYVKTAVEAKFSATALDYDNDSYVDNMNFVISGDAGAWSSLLWPHKWTLYQQNVTLQGKRVWEYNFLLENHFDVNNGRQSVLVHETYHTLSAPDLYVGSDGIGNPVGGWDVMASNNIPPQSSSAFVTHKYGHFTDEPQEITSSGTYTLYDMWDRDPGHKIGYKIPSPTSNVGEYFVLEYRRKSGTGLSSIYEAELPGEGIIISRINPVKDGNMGSNGTTVPYGVYVYRPGGTNTTNGTINSAFYSAQSGRTTFSDMSSPKAFLSNNTVGLGGIVINNISNSGEETMTFTVTFPTEGAPPVATDATNVGYTSFTANWNSSASTSDYLLSVYHKVSGVATYTGGGFSDLSVGNFTSYDVTDLDESVSTQWYYSVKAVSGGVSSVASNEITVQLTEYSPVSCEYKSNVLSGDELLTSWFGPNNGEIFGQNVNGYKQFAEFYQLPDAGKVTGFQIKVKKIENRSNNPNFTKVTVKLFDKNTQGLPGNILYSEDFAFNKFMVGDNTLSFATSTIVPSEFFIGYEIYYATSPFVLANCDEFAGISTKPRADDNNTTYIMRSNNSWYAAYNAVSDFYVSLFLFPQVCTLPRNTEWTPQGTSTDWNDAGNWTNDVPAPITKVVIPKSASYPILEAGNSYTAKSITFEAGAEIGRQDLLTYEKAYIQYDFSSTGLARDRWHSLTVPLQESYMGDFSFGGYPRMSLKKLISVDGTLKWQNATVIDPLTAGDGFVVWLDTNTDAEKGLSKAGNIIELPYFENPAAADVHFTHTFTPNVSGNVLGSSIFRALHETSTDVFDADGAESAAVNRTNAAYKLAADYDVTPNFGSDGEGNFALIGNPLVATIDFYALYDANNTEIKDNYQIWVGNSTVGGYAGHKAGAPVGFELTDVMNEYIAPLQAFIVEQKDGATNSALNFAPATVGATETANASLRSATATSDKLDIVARNATAAVRTFIAKRDGGNDTFGNLDARKLMNGIGNVPEVYTLKPLNSSMIQTSANIIGSDDLVIPVGIATAQSGETSLTFTGMDTYNAEITLIDTEDKVEQNLTGLETFEYKFNYVPKTQSGQAAANEERFFIKLRSTGSVTGLDEISGAINIYATLQTIHILSSEPVSQASVYTLQGTLVCTATEVNTIKNVVPGIYVVKVITAKGEKTTKVIVQ